jgi:sortase (surface protein transpeptidase)
MASVAANACATSASGQRGLPSLRRGRPTSSAFSYSLVLVLALAFVGLASVRRELPTPRAAGVSTPSGIGAPGTPARVAASAGQVAPGRHGHLGRRHPIGHRIAGHPPLSARPGVVALDASNAVAAIPAVAPASATGAALVAPSPAALAPPAPASPVPSSPVTAPPPAAWPSGAVAWLTVPAIGLDRPIFRGGQSTIDRGVATLFDDGPGGWRAPVAPGAPGTLWIAGHHTSHGAPGRHVDELAVGDVAIVRGLDGVPHTYRFVARRIVGTAVYPDVVYGRDPSMRRLELQTSMGSAHRLLLTGVLVAAG